MESTPQNQTGACHSLCDITVPQAPQDLTGVLDNKMVSEGPLAAPKPRLSIQTMLLNLLGCTTKISPVEDMSYMPTSKRLTLNNPLTFDLEEPPRLARSDSRSSKVSRKAADRKKRSVIIESPSGFQHEIHVDSQNELHELELLRAEVERRVQEAAARHAEMNTLARKKSIRDKDDNGGFPGHASRGASLRPASIAPVKRKPVPSMYPYSLPPNTPGSWSTPTLLNSSSPPARISHFEYLQEGEGIATTSSSHLSGVHSSSTDASSMENMHNDDTPCLSSDEADSSSIKSSNLPSTPPTSSPELPTVDLSAPDAQSIAPSPIEKDNPTPMPTVEEETLSRPRVLSPQPSIAAIDVYLFGVNAFPENMLAFEAGQMAKETRGDVHEHIRRAPQREEDQESFLIVAETITN